jgi:4-amino-4-deoxy-L-arabinose transferase-like glycosyltransferase
LQVGDYDQAYLEQLKAEKFPPDKSIDTLQYESYQPPLYYLLLTPVFLLFGGALIPLRLFSLALGAGVIVFAFLVVRELFPARPLLALAAAGFIAFIPQHVAMMAGVNSDSLAEGLMAMGLWLIVKGTKGTEETKGQWPARRWKVALALVVGAAFLTKVTVYPLAAVAAFAMLLRWIRQRPTVEWRANPGVKLATGVWEKGGAGWAVSSGGMPLENPAEQFARNWFNLQTWTPALWRAARPLVIHLLIVFVPALLLGALYWGRNLVVCGPLDAVCGNWHNQVVVGQPTTREWIAQHGWWGSDASLLNRFFLFTFDSFWGVFGWMGVFMDQRVYVALALYSAGLAAGAMGAAIRRPPLTAGQRDGLTLLGASGLITLAVYLYYNVSFVQHQGRYLFPALIPLGLAAAVGIAQWVHWLVAAARLKGQEAGQWVEWSLTFAPIAVMAALDVFALYRFIIPALT